MRSIQARAFRVFLGNRSILSQVVNHADRMASVTVQVPPKFNESTIRQLWEKHDCKAAVLFTIIE
jgi:hypothetical protein